MTVKANPTKLNPDPKLPSNFAMPCTLMFYDVPSPHEFARVFHAVLKAANIAMGPSGAVGLNPTVLDRPDYAQACMEPNKP